MTIEFDDKGKFFTDIISKEAVPSTLQTTTHLIRGKIYIHRETRLKDELDMNEKFLAITDASVLAPDGQELYQTKFMVVQCSKIVWVIPDSEMVTPLKAGIP